jgi:TetR/AcrR family transcriptional regulator, ethionamide resistance regulator
MRIAAPPPERKRIRRKPEQAEREILDQAEEFLRENDFRDLTIDEVMARTGMVRSAFYNYFRDRSELIMRLLQRIEGEMMEASRVWLGEGADAEDPVRAGRDALRRIAMVYARHSHLVRAIHEASYHDREVEGYYRDGVIEDFIQAVAARLRAERRAGRTGVRQPEELARALVLMNVNVFFERLGRSGIDKPAAVAGTLADIWVRAIYGEPRET